MNFDNETPTGCARRLGLVHQRPGRRGTSLQYLTWDDVMLLAVGAYWTKWCQRADR